MADSSNLGLPLLASAQAQKHVTVNEALTRLDGLVQLRLQSAGVTIPPSAVAGQCWAVPAGAVNAWAGQAGRIAMHQNGGWTFAVPQRGWRAFILDEACEALHDGSGWRRNVLAISPAGAAATMRALEFDHPILAGATSDTALIIPANAMVFGVTGRVLTDITGSLSAWQLGVAGSPDRFGSGLGLSAGSFVRGMLSQPTTEYAPAGLRLTATGGSFAGGTLRLVVHVLELSLPQP